MQEVDNTTRTELIEWVIKSAEDLCKVHDHITRVIGQVDIPEVMFTDQYEKEYSHQFEFDSMLRLLLYKQVNRFSYRHTWRKIRTWPYIQVRFGFHDGDIPTHQALSHTYRNRLSLQDRQTLSTLADALRELAVEYDIMSAPNEGPPIDPSEMGEDVGLKERELLRAVRIARDRVFTEFTTGRAENAKYDDSVFWEVFGYLCMTTDGKSNSSRRFTRLSNYTDGPHEDTFLRTLKLMGDPKPQTELVDYVEPMQIENWQRIRKTLLDPFDRAMKNLFDETDFGEHLREPVNVAIDITPWEFHPSPWDWKGNPKEDYPEMVSGTKKKHGRAYKFATLSVVSNNTPLVLAVEPVKEHSMWDTTGTVSRTPKADVVDRLLSKAQEYVDIHKVFCDREFSGIHVRDVIDRKGLFYIIPKPVRAKQDLDDIEDVKQHPVANMGFRTNQLTVHNRTHDVAFIYKYDEETENYVLFTTNAEMTTDRMQGLVTQYRDRWQIEIEYRTIKENFLLKTTSKDYRIRLFHFLGAVIMYNVWRVSNVLLRTLFDYEGDISESLLMTAGEIAEIVGLCLGPEVD